MHHSNIASPVPSPVRSDASTPDSVHHGRLTKLSGLLVPVNRYDVLSTYDAKERELGSWYVDKQRIPSDRGARPVECRR